MSKLQLKLESSRSSESLRKEILRKLTLLLILDPEAESEFLEKMEVRLWEVRLKQAGTDTKRLSRLMAVLYCRLGPIHKKLKVKKGDRNQLLLNLE